MEEGSARLSPECIHGAANKVREARRFDEMAKRKKRIATVNRKLGISISRRVQKPVLKDLDAYRKPLKLSRPARHRAPGRTEGASRKAVGRRLRTNVPGGQWGQR